jgi:hypothetical protein
MTLLQGDKLPVAMGAEILPVGGGWGRERKQGVGGIRSGLWGRGLGWVGKVKMIV